MNLKEMGWDAVDWTHVAVDRDIGGLLRTR
jgi:hypothetical protein